MSGYSRVTIPSLLSGSLRPFFYSSFVYSCHLLLISSASVRSILNLPAMQETWVRSLGWEDPLEKGMATHSSVLAWRIPWTEEPGRLQSIGSQRVGHD